MKSPRRRLVSLGTLGFGLLVRRDAVRQSADAGGESGEDRETFLERRCPWLGGLRGGAGGESLALLLKQRQFLRRGDRRLAVLGDRLRRDTLSPFLGGCDALRQVRVAAQVPWMPPPPPPAPCLIMLRKKSAKRSGS